MKRMDFDLFRLEDRVLFEAAAVAEIVEAAEAAQDNPNANVNEAEKQAQDERDALKNAPPENPADQTEQSEGDAQRDPSEAADIDAQVEQLIQGEIPVTDGDVDVTIPELGDSSSAVLEAGESGNLVDALIVPSDATISSGRELVVINGTVPDQDAILAALKPNQEVLVLEDGSGLAELNEYLDAHDGKYDAIHLVTHGNKGYLSINSEIINAENFNAAEWADVGEHLTDDGDILLYGCDTAATAEGRLLVDHIAEASGADVAASTDATGISGDWTLEYQHGVIDSAEISVENFEHNLTNYAVTNLNDSGDGSLRWAVEQANANAGTDEITFSTNGTIVLESEINITDGVTITGNGAESTVIDGNNTTRIFTIKNGICNLRKITFQNGYSDSYGGAIHAEDSILRLEDSSFLENNVVDGKGGAIWARAISLDVINCNFSKNSNAIYCIVADHLNVENSTFIQNTVDVPDFNGAAIRIVNTAVLGSTPLPILINNCSFIGNSSSGNGGAISCSSLSAVGRYSNLIILNCTFAENYATTNGGAVFKDNTCDLFIANSILVGNRAGNIFEDIYGATTAYYSLIGNAEGTLTGIHNQIGVVSSLVYGSEVPSVSVENVDGVEHSYCSILRSEWTLAGTKTGIYSEGQAEKIVILNEDQWIVVDDPAITVEAIDVIELTTDQLGNIRQDNGEYIIGAVNSSFELPIEMASLTVSTSEDIWDISDNRISLREAIAYAALGVSDSSGNKIITFDNNIFSTYSTITLDSAYGMLQIANGVFSNANPLIIDGSIGNNRTVTFDGGSVSQILRIGQTNTLYLNNLTFQNGSASNGGAIYTTGDSLVVNNSTFINNCAQNGGSIYNEEGALTIINSTFTKNTAQVGGALYNKGSLTILNTILVGNDTNDIFNNGNGRAYYSLIGTVSLENWSTEAGSMNNVSVEDTFLVDSDGNIVIESDEMAHVKYGGLAHGKGIYVWHNEDYSAIAYSVTKEGQKTAVTGNIDDATICISIDQRGRERIDPVDIGAEVVTQKNIIIEPESPDFLYSIIAQEYDGTTIVDNAVIQVVVDGKIIELSWKSAFFNSADVLGVTTATFKDLSCKDIAYKLSSDTITLDATELRRMRRRRSTAARIRN